MAEGLFFALLPDDDVADDIFRFAGDRAYQYRVSAAPIEPDRLHLTLIGVDRAEDRLPSAVIENALIAGGAVSGSSFDIRFDRMMTFRQRDRKPTVLAMSRAPLALRGLHRALCDHLNRPMPRFKPHVTLFWDDVQLPAGTLETPFTWRVREFALIRSHYGKSRHDRLQVWPLTFV